MKTKNAKRLQVLLLSWYEIVTAYPALEQAVDSCPSGCFVSVQLDRLFRRIKKGRKGAL